MIAHFTDGRPSMNIPDPPHPSLLLPITPPAPRISDLAPDRPVPVASLWVERYRLLGVSDDGQAAIYEWEGVET